MSKSNPKPTQKVGEPFWDYFEVIQYMEEKYPDIVSDDIFWTWLINRYGDDVNNGSFHYLDICMYLEEDKETVPDEIKKILRLIKKEFKENEMRMWIEW